MSLERTLSIIKPDATKRHIAGKIITKFEENGLKVVALKRVRLSRAEAEMFYGEHKERGFFGELVDFMMSEPVIIMVLEGEDAVAVNRRVMGATNKDQADEGTIRKEFALSVGENSVHGSDSIESAKREISFFFAGNELLTA